MRVKTFQGRTLEEVLPQVREQLGPEAVVLGQRNVVQGGVGGFFGKRMIEVSAADRMPSDAELIELEDRFMGGDDLDGSDHEGAASSSSSAARSRIDVRDDWDPSGDEELAAEYGAVLQRVAASSTTIPVATAAIASLEPLDAVASLTATPSAVAMAVEDGGEASSAAGYDRLGRRAVDRGDADTPRGIRLGVATTPEPVVEQGPDPAVEARHLAIRAHEAIAAATQEIERQIGTSSPRRPDILDQLRVPTTLSATVGPSIPVSSLDHVISDVGTENGAAAGMPAPATPAPSAAPAPSTGQPAAPLSLPDMHALLTDSGVDPDIASALLQRMVLHRIPFSGRRDLRESLREVVAESIMVDSGWTPVGRSHRVAIVGASGAGKSSIVAKLAEGYISTGLRVGVVSVIAGVAGRTQISAQANDPIVRRGTLDVRYAADAEQMMIALEHFADRDVVFIDTPSAAYLDSEVYASVMRCFAGVRIDDVQVVVPLATSVREAQSIVDHFRPLGAKHLIVSKLDESRYAGQLVNYCYRFGMPITFLTDGPRIPEDVRAASAVEIAALVVPDSEEEGI